MIPHTIDIPSGMSTKVFVLARGALNDLPAVLNEMFPGKRPWILEDDNTKAAAGIKVMEILNANGFKPYPPYTLPGKPKPHPLVSLSEELAKLIPADAIPLAVGSGVINDLLKVASGMKNMPYVCVPTAASVDGYTSAGGAMVIDGYKKTVPCPPPTAIVADMDVLESAPPEMLAGGYGDLYSKVTAGGEWLIADALGIEPIEPSVWKLVQEPLRRNLSDSKNVGFVFNGLAATGYSMQMYHDSRPASGAEHLCSHIWEMEGHTYRGESVSHDFMVAVATVAIIKVMYFIINHSADEACKMAKPGLTKEERIAEIDRILVKGCYGAAGDTAREKLIAGAELQARRELIFKQWPLIQERLKKQLYTPEEAIKMLKGAGAPTHYTEIGLPLEQFLHAPRAAQLIRKRYTCLDMLYEAGLLDAAIATIA